ncbi:MAG TPA: hypothetical protein VFJ85_01535 [Acidimicrobiales bacterium]|nr:hypothetical protein [Acidimicrobiales bacterium]
MTDAHLHDKVLGLELELVELVEQRERAHVQGRQADVARLTREIAGVHDELARAADDLARSSGAPSFRRVRRAAA